MCVAVRSASARALAPTRSSPRSARRNGEVYRARDTRLGREVALKILPPGFATDPERAAPLRARSASRGALNHPNIVTVYDVGVHEGTPFIVFELVEGEHATRRASSLARFRSRKALDLATQVAEGSPPRTSAGSFTAISSPRTSWLTRDGRVKILDFGLAKRLTGSDERADAPPRSRALTVPARCRHHRLHGAGAAPRTARGRPDRSLRARRDPLRDADRSSRVPGRDAGGRPERDPLGGARTASGPGTPHGSHRAQRVLKRTLEKDPGARPQHARDLAFDLELLGAINPAPAGPASADGPRSRALLVGAALLALVGIAALAWSLTHARSGAARVTYQRVTFRNGIVHNARFTPDGRAIVYSAEWDGESTDVYTAQAGSPETRSLGYRNAALLAVSSGGDLGIAFHSLSRPHLSRQGTLARVPRRAARRARSWTASRPPTGRGMERWRCSWCREGAATVWNVPRGACYARPRGG